MRKYIIYLLILAVVPVVLFAAEKKTEPDPVDQKELKEVIVKAKEAIKKDAKGAEADFYLARAMGLITCRANLESFWREVDELIYGRGLLSTSIMNDKFSKSFVDFFFNASAAMWGPPVEGCNEKILGMEIAYANDLGYFVGIDAYPEFEQWFMQDSKKGVNAVLPLTSRDKPPAIVVVKVKDNKAEKRFKDLDMEPGSLQYIWPIELYDLDSDKVPEIFIRCNSTRATGFTQYLYIYKIKGDEVKLIKTFEGHSEGVARRVKGNTFEVGYGCTDKVPSEGHMGEEKTCIETWEYKNGDFKKLSEKKIPHICRNDDWMNYYFPKK